MFKIAINIRLFDYPGVLDGNPPFVDRKTHSSFHPKNSAADSVQVAAALMAALKATTSICCRCCRKSCRKWSAMVQRAWEPRDATWRSWDATKSGGFQLPFGKGGGGWNLFTSHLGLHQQTWGFDQQWEIYHPKSAFTQGKCHVCLNMETRIAWPHFLGKSQQIGEIRIGKTELLPYSTPALIPVSQLWF